MELALERNSQKIYDRYADSMWDTTHKFQRLLASQVYPRMQYFNKVVKTWKGMEVLDLGCGSGYMSEELHQLGAIVTGIDANASIIKAASKHACSSVLDIRYHVGTGESLPFNNNTFNIVVCVDVLEHVNDVKKVISEISRVLKSGGLFLFDTINRNRVAGFMAVTLVEDVLRIIPGGTHDPRRFIRPEELRQYLEASGFNVPDKFSGMGFTGINRHLELQLGLTSSTRVMYIGYAHKL